MHSQNERKETSNMKMLTVELVLAHNITFMGTGDVVPGVFGLLFSTILISTPVVGLSCNIIQSACSALNIAKLNNL